MKAYLTSILTIILTWLVIFFSSSYIGFSNALLLGVITISFISWQTDTVITAIAMFLILLPSIGYLISMHQLAKLPNLEALAIFVLITLTFNLIIRRVENRPKIKEYQRQMEDYKKRYIQAEKAKQQTLEEIKARDEFLAIVSHELKTPLSTMLLQIQLVLHNVRNVSLANFSVDNLLKMLDNAERQSQRLSRMIGDLLNVSLITTGRIDLERHPMDLVEITKTTLDNFSEKLKKDGYTVDLQVESDPIEGNWDKIRIEQVLTNLLTNAIKYGSQKPLTIILSKNRTHAILTVADQGIGIPEEKRDLIFARFARAVPSQKYDGLGVGLFITNQIVTAHGGQIKVHSKPNKGSKFTIELPLA
jgi:signal transduction histidine kinase